MVAENPGTSPAIPDLIPLSADEGIECGPYRDVLNQAFDNNRIANIGIIGPHASGKTSLLKSYDHRRNEKQRKGFGRFAYITLGDYVRSEGDAVLTEPIPPAQPAQGAASEKSSLEVTAELQRRVIEQLLCYIPPKALWQASVNPLFRTMRMHRVTFLRFVVVMLTLLSAIVAIDGFGVTTALQESWEKGYVTAEINKEVDRYLTKYRESVFGTGGKAGDLVSQVAKEARRNAKRENRTDVEAEISSSLAALEKLEDLEKRIGSAEESLKTTIEARVARNSPVPTNFMVVRLVCLVLCGGCLTLLVFWLKSKSITISGLTTGAGAITMEQDTTLPFESHIDDLLYLMSLSDSKVFVFEDIDRVDQRARILSSLRELNFKLNTTLETRDAKRWWRVAQTFLNPNASSPKPYKFVYCIQSDCIADAEERTKFFDLIIPVVPYGDFSNFGGLLCDHFKKIKTEYQIDDKLLRRAGMAINNMRLYENIIDEFVIQRSLLATPAEMPVRVFDSSLFALVAYKNLCPADYYDLVERERGYLYRLLTQKLLIAPNVYSAVGEPWASMSPYDRARMPFVEIARACSGTPEWETGVTQYLSTLELGVCVDERTKSFVRYCLENGYIRERFHLFASRILGQMNDTDRAFCLSVDARYWPSPTQAEKLPNVLTKDAQTQPLSDPALVAQWLQGMTYLGNTRLLNGSLLVYLLGHVTSDGRGSLELRYLLDDMVHMMADTTSDDGLRFFALSLTLAEGYKLLAVLTDRYQAQLSSLSFAGISRRLGPDVKRRRLVAVSLLRMVAREGLEVGQPTDKYDLDKLKCYLRGDNNFLAVWTDVRLPEDSPVVKPEVRDKFAASEIAQGLQLLGVQLPRVFSDELAGWDPYSQGAMDDRLVKEVYNRDCYTITADNVEFILDKLEGVGAPIRPRMLTLIHDRLGEECPIYCRLIREKEEFVRMVVREQSTIHDSETTAQWVLSDDNLPDDLRAQYAQKLYRKPAADGDDDGQAVSI